MTNAPLLKLLEGVFGYSYHRKDDNYAFKCPNCKHQKHKLEISLSSVRSKDGKVYQNPWKCWVCGDSFSGSNLFSLFKRISATPAQFDELGKYVTYTSSNTERNRSATKLPKEYIFLGDLPKCSGIDRLVGNQCMRYLRKRGINEVDIHRYRIGFCSTGTYALRIIMPSLDRYGNINYFVARKNNDLKNDIIPYLKPENSDQNIIPCEYWIDFSQPIRIVEGMMDMYASRFNTIPTLGLVISEELELRLLLEAKEIHICLDRDNAGFKQLFRYAEYYRSFGKVVRIVDTKDKDPSQIGFEKTQNAFKNAPLYGNVERIMAHYAKAKMDAMQRVH